MSLKYGTTRLFANVGMMSLASVCMMAHEAGAALTPIGLSGYNQDVVYEVGATGSGNGKFKTEDAALMENGLNGQTDGLPVGGLLNSNVAGTTFQFAPYNAANSLIVGEDNGALAKFGTLTFAAGDKQAYNKIALLGLSRGGDSNFSMVVFYTDGTNSGVAENEGNPNTRGVFQNNTLPDWFNNGGSSQNGTIAPATGDLRRVDSNTGIDNGFGVNLQQITYDLSAFSTVQYGDDNFNLASKPIDFITFESTGGGDKNRTFLAISGEAVAVPEPTALGLVAAGGLLALRRRRATV